jgi:hypothetical protein
VTHGSAGVTLGKADKMNKMFLRIKPVVTCAALVAMAAFANKAGADTLFYYFDHEFSGGQAPAGAAPWTQASFADTSTAGTVLLTVKNVQFTGTENISGLYFNLNPGTGFNPNNLVFSSYTSMGTFTAPTIGTGENAFKADGDGDYDFLFNFATGTVNTFAANDSFTLKITETGVPNLKATDFEFLSNPDGGHGPFYAAAHVQNTTGAGNGGSGWVEPDVGMGGVVVATPEPSASVILLLSLGLWRGGRYLVRRA